jgi:hypothetical protein
LVAVGAIAVTSLWRRARSSRTSDSATGEPV